MTAWHMLSVVVVVVLVLVPLVTVTGHDSLNAGMSGNPYVHWSRGLPGGEDYFPIAVWLQSPENAVRFKEVGINLFVGLWRGPTEKQLSALAAAGMPVVCEQNEVGLRHLDDPVIVGWMHGDEPDNAQPAPGGGWGPPIAPEVIIADYERIKAADPTRPVLLNLGQGVAWDGWYGRGVRTNHPEDYEEYVKGCDIVSFDIYSVVHDSPEVAGKLGFVARGVDRLRRWTGDRKVVWNCIECTRISNVNVRPTPEQVKAEVWMALVHGSMGLIYFVHQFQPEFIEAGLLADPEMVGAVTAINLQIQSLARLLNSPSRPELATVSSSEPETPVDIMVKEQNGERYVFAVAMGPRGTTATFALPGLSGQHQLEVLGEGRLLKAADGTFSDQFPGWGVHLYRVIAR